MMELMEISPVAHRIFKISIFFLFLEISVLFKLGTKTGSSSISSIILDYAEDPPIAVLVGLV